MNKYFELEYRDDNNQAHIAIVKEENVQLYTDRYTVSEVKTTDYTEFDFID